MDYSIMPEWIREHPEEAAKNQQRIYGLFQDAQRTLRDQFAMAALTGIIADLIDLNSTPVESVTALAYDFADAMLKAREETK